MLTEATASTLTEPVSGLGAVAIFRNSLGPPARREAQAQVTVLRERKRGCSRLLPAAPAPATSKRNRRRTDWHLGGRQSSLRERCAKLGLSGNFAEPAARCVKHLSLGVGRASKSGSEGFS